MLKRPFLPPQVLAAPVSSVQEESHKALSPVFTTMSKKEQKLYVLVGSDILVKHANSPFKDVCLKKY